MSESRSQNFGITPPSSTTCTLRSGLQPVDYVTLNDGFDDEPTVNPRKRKRVTHQPRSAPSATRVAAQKHTTTPEAKEASNKHNKESNNTLSGIPSSGIPSTSTTHTTTDTDLTGVPGSENRLPDLVTDHESDIAKTVDPVSMEEELEIADALLSLGEVQDDTIKDDDNSQLMPVGAPTSITDVAPVPVMLDQINVYNAIAGIKEAEELDKAESNVTVPVPGEDDKGVTKATTTDDVGATNTVLPNTENRPKSASSTQGSLKIKTHALKKKADSNWRYKCSVCGVSKPTVQQVNEHHLKKHKPQICTICGRTFALALSLTRHMYNHEQQCYNCDNCDYTLHFESELKAHKIVHRKNPAFQYMVKNCGKWFCHKWELTMHVKKHDGEEFKCNECDFTTNLEKHLKEHKLKHSDDCPYLCKICNKGFHYRSRLKRHRDHEHK